LAPLDASRLEITGLAADSRKVEPGFLFAALPGARADGLDFVADAVRRGASAVLAPAAAEAALRRHLATAGDIALILDANPRQLFAQMAARFFGRQPELVAAVTGTNGKTSVVSFLRQIWTYAGRPAASLGTLGLTAPGSTTAGSLTTPDPVVLHRTLASLADDGVACLAIEASSHGLDQFRLDGVRIAAGAFTNLGRDHLDYHVSIEHYLAAKLRLFATLIEDGGAAVICADDLCAGRVRAAAAARGLRIVSYGRHGSDLRLRALAPIDGGQRLTLSVHEVIRTLDLPLAGEFQALNALAAAGLAIATGTDSDVAFEALGHLQPVRGRLESVGRVRGAVIYVDYAHTPDALAVVLRALRPQTRRRLSLVFGCGGDRDPGKRPQMGEVARTLADQVIVTDDNPRTEDPKAIRRAILATCPQALEMADRAEAIARAVAALDDGDVLVVAGKGHEQGQIVGDQVLPFDDAEVIRSCLREDRH
jgi:UDP-N-acetylmuramoyl-L-alanyl-D-glutamate--2,6-diaminopimelate ligase